MLRSVDRLVVPRRRIRSIESAGWLTKHWWSNGGYAFRYKGRTFWRLCLEHRERPNVGYNAVVTQVGNTFRGLVWKDSSTVRWSDKALAQKVLERILSRRQ